MKVSTSSAFFMSRTFFFLLPRGPKHSPVQPAPTFPLKFYLPLVEDAISVNSFLTQDKFLGLFTNLQVWLPKFLQDVY